MTDYIKEMMRAVGVNERGGCFNEYAQYSIPCEVPCVECAYYDVKLPTFTAEKQLEIIKFIGKIYPLTIFVNVFSNNLIIYYCRIKQPRVYKKTENQIFSQALAHLVTQLINAGELDKAKVKRILEG